MRIKVNNYSHLRCGVGDACEFVYEYKMDGRKRNQEILEIVIEKVF
jgi:hypothetical protein